MQYRLTFMVEVEVAAMDHITRDDVADDFSKSLKFGVNYSALYIAPYEIKRIGVLDTPPVIEPPLDVIPQVITVQRAARKASE